MEERRFDAWTRTLGAATSRRQVLKGVLGGVVALVAGRVAEPVVAEAAGTCNQRDCQRKVDQFFTTCIEGCAVSGAIRGSRDPRTKAYCRSNCYLASKSLSEQCRHNGGCFGSDATCCNDQCVDVESDPNNCGACGHACPEGHPCIDGQCQCDDGETYCGDQCIDTQTDNNNCGSCGHTCGSCETCLGGECQPLNCGSGKTCCQHLCVDECQGGPPDPSTCLCDVCDGQADGLSCGPEQVCCDQHCMSEACPEGKTFDLGSCSCQCTPITCPDGQTQDPVTCQCVSICLTAPAGTSCGTNMECCGQQCVSTQCPAGRQFSTTTCQCECTPIECPSGETQDPLTCQCSSKCAGVTCDTCQTCDPESGTCVDAETGTGCGGDNICCGGSCVAGPTCPDFCAEQPLGAPCGAAHYCCGADQQCVNPLDTIGIDNHCCLQGTFWSDADYACVTAIEWCNAIGMGEPCGSEINGYSMPICCDLGYTCESGACVPQ